MSADSEQPKKSWRSPKKKILSPSVIPVDGSTVESWDRGVHRGVLANVVITKYAVIIGPNVSFVNVAMTTTDQKVRGTNYQ